MNRYYVSFLPFFRKTFTLEAVPKENCQLFCNQRSTHIYYTDSSQQTFVLMKTSWRRLEDVLRFRLQKTSWRHLQDVLIKTNMFALALRLQKTSSEDVFKTSWSRPIYFSWPYVFKTSSRRFEDVFKTSSRPLQGVFKASSRRFEDVFKMSSRHLQDVLQRYLQDVFKAYHQVNLFYLTRPWEVFNTFLSTEEFA